MILDNYLKTINTVPQSNLIRWTSPVAAAYRKYLVGNLPSSEGSDSLMLAGWFCAVRYSVLSIRNGLFRQKLVIFARNNPLPMK